MAQMNPVYLILMGNTKPCDDDYIKRLYDLKGSMVKREVFPKKRKEVFPGNKVLKDMNFLNLKKDEIFLKFTKWDADYVMQQIARDICLLNQFNLMDYSLLTVITFNPDYVEKFPEEF